ncbi:MAG: protease HtpX [Pseudomonadales bacterium]|nr:protease HtpX [Pseudomonadales bacterium]
MLRILLFLGTNLAVMIMAGLIMNILGIGSTFSHGQQQLGPLLVLCFIWGSLGSLISLALSKWIARKATGAEIITQPNSEAERWLLSTVANLAERAGINMPEVAIFDSVQSNAFATGWNRNDALVAVSTGLLQRMNRDEIRAVLGHEIGHVANGDMVTMALIQGILNAFVMFFARIIGNFVDRSVFNNESDSPGIAYYITSMIGDVVLGLLANIILMWFSRYREFRADAAGARLAGSNSMISALERLQQEQGLPDPMPNGMHALAITEGQHEGFSLAALMASHPPLEERIQALKGQH